MDKNIPSKQNWGWRQALTNYAKTKIILHFLAELFKPSRGSHFHYVDQWWASVTVSLPVVLCSRDRVPASWHLTWQQTWHHAITPHVNVLTRPAERILLLLLLLVLLLPGLASGSSWCCNKVGGVDLSVCRTFIFLFCRFLYLYYWSSSSCLFCCWWIEIFQNVLNNIFTKYSMKYKQ